MRVIGKSSVSSGLARLLAVIYYAVVVALVLAALLTVASTFMPMDNVTMNLPTAFRLESSVASVTSSSLAAGSARLEDATGSGNLIFRPSSRVIVAMAGLGVFAWMAFVLWIVGQLRAVSHTLRDGRPFVRANATRIRHIAYAVMGGELLRSVISIWWGRYVMATFSADGLRFDAHLDLNVGTLLMALVLLVIAEVFRTGAQLDEEQSLTV